MTHEEYIDKTREVTNFLMKVFSDNVQCVATIISAQADQNTDRLADILGLVKGRCEDWLEELHKIEPSSTPDKHEYTGEDNTPF